MTDTYILTDAQMKELLNEQKELCAKEHSKTIIPDDKGFLLSSFDVFINASSPDYSKFKVEENDAVEFDLRERSEIVDIAIRCEESYDSRELIEWFTKKFKNRNK